MNMIDIGHFVHQEQLVQPQAGNTYIIPITTAATTKTKSSAAKSVASTKTNGTKKSNSGSISIKNRLSSLKEKQKEQKQRPKQEPPSTQITTVSMKEEEKRRELQKLKAMLLRKHKSSAPVVVKSSKEQATAEDEKTTTVANKKTTTTATTTSTKSVTTAFKKKPNLTGKKRLLLLKQKQKEAAAVAAAAEADKKKNSGFSIAKMIANELVFACTPAHYYEKNIDDLEYNEDEHAYLCSSVEKTTNMACVGDRLAERRKMLKQLKEKKNKKKGGKNTDDSVPPTTINVGYMPNFKQDNSLQIDDSRDDVDDEEEDGTNSTSTDSSSLSSINGANKSTSLLKNMRTDGRRKEKEGEGDKVLNGSNKLIRASLQGSKHQPKKKGLSTDTDDEEDSSVGMSKNSIIAASTVTSAVSSTNKPAEKAQDVFRRRNGEDGEVGEDDPRIGHGNRLPSDTTQEGNDWNNPIVIPDDDEDKFVVRFAISNEKSNKSKGIEEAPRGMALTSSSSSGSYSNVKENQPRKKQEKKAKQSKDDVDPAFVDDKDDEIDEDEEEDFEDMEEKVLQVRLSERQKERRLKELRYRKELLKKEKKMRKALLKQQQQQQDARDDLDAAIDDDNNNSNSTATRDTTKWTNKNDSPTGEQRDDVVTDEATTNTKMTSRSTRSAIDEELYPSDFPDQPLDAEDLYNARYRSEKKRKDLQSMLQILDRRQDDNITIDSPNFFDETRESFNVFDMQRATNQSALIALRERQWELTRLQLRDDLY
jgi:hypothetical protein